jgi:hypothetical protein
VLNYSWKANPNRWGRPEFNTTFSIGFGNGLISYVKIQALASRMCDVVYDVIRFIYDIIRATYDITEKCTTSYILYRFLPVVRAISPTTSYVF